MAVRIADTVRSDMATVVKNAIDVAAAAGRLRIYKGVKPVVKGTAPPGADLLADIPLVFPVGVVATGTLTFTVPFDANASASGVATFFYIEDNAGVFVLDGDVGVAMSGAQLILNSTSLVAGKQVEIVSFTVTLGGA